MKILFDYISVQISCFRGIGRYANNLCKALLAHDLEITLLTSRKFPLSGDAWLKSLKKVEFENFECDEKFDFLFVSNFFNPNMPTCLTPEVMSAGNSITGIIYDLIPLIFKENYIFPGLNDKIYENQCETAFFANFLFSISKSTKDDFVKLLDYPASKIEVINGGIDKIFFSSLEDIEKNDNIILLTGTDFRKNTINAVTAYCLAVKEGAIPDYVKLEVICACDDDFKKAIAKAAREIAPGLESNIEVTGYISDDELVRRMQSARLGINPSLYEGLCLPVIESYACGLPCIGSNTSALKEILPEECQFDPYSLQCIKNRLVEAWHNEELRANSLQFGQGIIPEYTWQKSAALVYDKLVELQNARKSAKQRNAIFCSELPDALLREVSRCPESWDIYLDKLDDTNYDFQALESYVVPFKFPAFTEPLINTRRNYSQLIYILHNSDASFFVLEAARMHKSGIIILTDIKLDRLFKVWVEKFEKLSSSQPGIQFPDRSWKNDVISFLIHCTGIKDFIVPDEKIKRKLTKNSRTVSAVRIATLSEFLSNRPKC